MIDKAIAALDTLVELRSERPKRGKRAQRRGQA
jgi:hypothetical protein